MTVPIEEGNALIYARLFIRSLLFKDMTPRVPPHLREEARNRLRHLPAPYQIRGYIEQKYGKEVADQLADSDEVWNSMLLAKGLPPEKSWSELGKETVKDG